LEVTKFVAKTSVSRESGIEWENEPESRLLLTGQGMCWWESLGGQKKVMTKHHFGGCVTCSGERARGGLGGALWGERPTD